MRTLRHHLQIRPHGERLLTSSAAFWLFSARVLVFAMASAEAVAWGYLGFLFGEGPVRVAVAAFTGIAIFLVVWMIDVSLITLDRAWAEHARAILGQVSSSRGRTARDVFTFTLRIGLLLASLTITAPYLAQLVFYKDIEQYTTAEATTILDTARHDLQNRYDLIARDKEREIETKRHEYEMEVAGKGASGRYGSGPAAAALKSSVETLAGDLESIAEDRARELSAFDEMSRDWRVNRDQLAARYNVVLPQASILQNRKALEELRKRPENRSTELAIKAFLAFIFCGLLLLKLFEPSSIRLYLSEVLQQEYERYLAGTFDPVLPPTETSTGHPAAMSPQRFYAFLVSVWAPARALEQQQAEVKARRAVATESIDLLDKMCTQAQREVEQVHAEVQRLYKGSEEANQSLTELQSAIVAVRKDVESLSGELVALDANQDVDEFGRLKYRTHLRKSLNKANTALRELEESVPTENERQRRATAALVQAEARLQTSEQELSAREQELRNLRAALAAEAGTRARTAVGATAN